MTLAIKQNIDIYNCACLKSSTDHPSKRLLCRLEEMFKNARIKKKIDQIFQ
jgi:hypothetical protein